MVREERRESFNIREGDIFRIRAGTTAYLVNKDNNERLILAKIIQPVNTPGNFEVRNISSLHSIGFGWCHLYQLRFSIGTQKSGYTVDHHNTILF